MKKLLTFALAVFLAGIFVGNTQILAQPTAVIKIEALSFEDLDNLGWTTWRSSGLPVVGRGELVYLSGWDGDGEEVTGYAWSFDSVPLGSTVALDSTDKMWTTFRPDTTGRFVVKLEVTTASGVDDTTINITSALYVGVAGLPPSCQFCHSTNVSGWEETKHSSKFTRDIDGNVTVNGATYQAVCAKCHTVGFNPDSTAVNDGFDDIVTETGYVFPDALQPGNWDSLVANFPDVAAKANIQCEMCHGPGSEHSGDKSKIAYSLDEGVCGQCHDALDHHVKNTQWRNSRHGNPSGNRASRSPCANCHSSYGFVARLDQAFADRGRVFGEPSITCAACHDPHSINNPNQLRRVEDVELGNGVIVSFGNRGRLCMNCHISRRNADTYVEDFHSHFGPHHSNQTDMLAGTNAVDFGFEIPSSNHRNVVPDLCITCHMSPTPGHGEPGENKIGEHTWTMHYDNETPEDPSDDIDNVSACVNCHGPVTSFDDFIAKQDYDQDGEVEGVQHEIEGLLDLVGKLLPPIGDPDVVVTAEYTPTELRAAYNHAFVHDDGSHGVHNFQFALNLLRVAHAALTTGDLGAGVIMDIADIPNDQGKNVRVVWERFSGDGTGNLPIEEYSLWRRVDDHANGLGKAVKTVGFDEVVESLNELEVGTRVLVNGELWDFAGTVPASGQDYYSALAPTLYDSTITDGMHWSFFVVSGHTDLPAVHVVSEPDSGYSLDNLAPAVPMNLSALETTEGVIVDWEDAVDEDVKFFSLYRRSTGETELIGTATESEFTDVDVTIGQTYYYQVSGTDFAGNQGALTPEFALMVTSVEPIDLAAIPEDFVLRQNYPNPFNPSTEIGFGLPREEEITLAVYNVLGARVRTLAEGAFAIGHHRVIWDGTNDAGNVVGPGMYFYRLETRSTTLTNKMILLK